MTMSHDKFNQFLSKCAKDENLKSEFVKDPETVLKANGLNPDDIPDNVAEKMSAAGIFGDAGAWLHNAGKEADKFVDKAGDVINDVANSIKNAFNKF